MAEGRAIAQGIELGSNLRMLSGATSDSGDSKHQAREQSPRPSQRDAERVESPATALEPPALESPAVAPPAPQNWFHARMSEDELGGHFGSS